MKHKHGNTDECERCSSIAVLLPSGICQKCWDEIQSLRLDPEKRKARLRTLRNTESGVIRQTSRNMLLETHQSSHIRPLTLSGVIKARETRKTIQVAQREQADLLLQATRDQIAATRANDSLKPELVSVNAEFMRWLSTHPEFMRELPPRKFEEVVAAILEDLGHSVELTPQTRDGGYDIMAVMRTALGDVLTIVECKRWLPPSKVDIAVIERFLYAIRDKTRANRGLIATTTQFSIDAQKHAQDFEYLLRLADYRALKCMLKDFGRWHQTEGQEIWVPDYTQIADDSESNET